MQQHVLLPTGGPLAQSPDPPLADKHDSVAPRGSSRCLGAVLKSLRDREKPPATAGGMRVPASALTTSHSMGTFSYTTK
jgi:hypothetical protein